MGAIKKRFRKTIPGLDKAGKYLEISLYGSSYALTSYLRDDKTVPKIKYFGDYPVFKERTFFRVEFTQDGRLVHLDQPIGGMAAERDLAFLKEHNIPAVLEVYDTVIIYEISMNKVVETLYNINLYEAYEKMKKWLFY